MSQNPVMHLLIHLLSLFTKTQCFCLNCCAFQDVGFQHGKLLFTGWARGDIIENMLKDHRSAAYNDGKRTDVRRTHMSHTCAHLSH